MQSTNHRRGLLNGARSIAFGLSLAAVAFAAPLAATTPDQCRADCDRRFDTMAEANPSNSGAASRFYEQCNSLCDTLESEQAAFQDCIADPERDRQECIDAYNENRPDFSDLNWGN